MILCFSIIINADLIAQGSEVSTSQNLDQSATDSGKNRKGTYRGRISQEYLQKFSTMSKDLEIKKEEQESTVYRLEAVKARSKKVEEKEQQKLFSDNIASLKLTIGVLEDEIKQYKKALRLLQEHKTQPDLEKNNVLLEVSKIELKIEEIRKKYENEKLNVIIEGVDSDERNVYENPPKADCNIVFNGIDAVTKRQKIEVQREFLFGYTHPKLRSYFKDEFFLNCYAKMVKLDKKYYLWLYISIASKDAIKTYGRIDQNSTLKFELLSGEILYAQNLQSAIGQLEAYTGNTNYEIILPLDKSKYKLLSKGEIDRLGIMWSSGYEQYEIYNVDVVKNQIECLKSE
ncbi:hypothetical protein GCM10007940_46660 [Portibacter lacus]|uniref:Uncharacterized protein n=2 Tax=Portibacter lacus TaxID=1099794 RepID=A0AA37SVM2_9BACT|nr:hypothetical protein GCM10007940_46660 [Portibacter lacus]